MWSVYRPTAAAGQVCLKRRLDQREAAEFFGGDVNPFSRDANGKTKPSLALVKLLRVFDSHPELVDKVRVSPPRSVLMPTSRRGVFQRARAGCAGRCCSATSGRRLPNCGALNSSGGSTCGCSACT